MNSPQWYETFFGKYYMDGDNSLDGYRSAQIQSLRDRTIAEVDGVIRLLELGKDAKILDIPCGYGRHAIELAGRGFNVTGVDLNHTHLDKARRISAQKGRLIRLIHEDMRKTGFLEEFDAVINMFFSFGFYKTDEENFQALRKFCEALKHGGQFLMHTDVNVPRIEKGKYKLYEERRLVSGGILTIKEKFVPDTKRIEGSWTINDETRHYSVRVFTKNEFIKWCLGAGFQTCEAYSSWDRADYSEDGEDMIIVATK
jgi:cyclopropane fatty-acyl-phospholipid synthase-like methyltransferase